MSGAPGEPGVPKVPDDDELAAMLGARASRVGASDAREVLTAVRAEIAGPQGSAAGDRGGRAFGVRPVRIDRPGGAWRGRGSRMSWRVAVLGMAAVVAVAMLGSRLSLGPANPDAGTSPSASVGRSSAAERSQVEMLTPAELDAGVLDGSLVGRTVLVFGHLDRRLGSCRLSQPPPDGCWWLVFSGLEDRQIDPGSYRYDDLGLALARQNGDEPVALRVLGSEVDLLGWVVDGADGTRTPSAFDASGVVLDRTDLALLDGWLAPPHGDAAVCTRVVFCGGPWARLTDASPFSGGGAWTAGVPGIDVSIPDSLGLTGGADVMTGHFLVTRVVQRGGSYAPYRVVATLDGEARWVQAQATGTPPSPSSPPVADGDHMTAAEFRRGLQTGTLDGRVVVVDGRLRLAFGRCRAGGEDSCTWLQLEGLDGVFIDRGDLDVTAAEAAIRRHPDVGPIALRVTGTGVALLGWITAGAATPVTVEALADGGLPLDPGDVVAVAGWVVGAQDSFCGATPETCAMWPVLSPSEPIPGVFLYGDAGMAVMVADSLGLEAAPAKLQGPFIVRTRRSPGPGEPGLEIVDRFTGVVVVDPLPAASAPSASPSSSRVAGDPLVVCRPSTSMWSHIDANGSQVPIAIALTCANAVAAALAIAGPQPAIESIEFGSGYWCPLGVGCALALPNTGHVVLRRTGVLPDLLVGVTADESGKVTATVPVPLPTPSTDD